MDEGFATLNEVKRIISEYDQIEKQLCAAVEGLEKIANYHSSYDSMYTQDIEDLAMDTLATIKNIKGEKRFINDFKKLY